MSTSAIPHDPFQNFRFFEDAVTRLISEPRGSRPWSPAVDIFETEDALTLRADLPDVNTDEIDIRVENNTLTLKGSRKFVKDENAKGYHRIERSYGDFLRSFAIPQTVETDKVAAQYTNGVLTITLPKKENAKPRQVKVAIN
jgi:HSP20 family protein